VYFLTLLRIVGCTDEVTHVAFVIFISMPDTMQNNKQSITLQVRSLSRYMIMISTGSSILSFSELT
jgi:hypothetical protein